MTSNRTDPGGNTWALQGCLFGAVAIFVVLLIVMLFLGYNLFREHTQPDAAEPSLSAAPATLDLTSVRDA